MAYEVDGRIVECNDSGYLNNPDDWDADVARAIAAAEGIELSERAWDLITFLRDEYINNSEHQPNDRNILKAMSEKWGEKLQARDLYGLFPMQPSKQAAKIAGLPESRRKGGY